MTEVLTGAQKAFYEEQGYLILENRVPVPILDRIRQEIARFTEVARGMTASDDKIDLEDSHTPDDQRLSHTDTAL